jgi:hypothetical protein
MTLDPELQRLVESARAADLPDDARVKRVREQLLERLGPVGPETASNALLSTKTAATGFGAIAVKTVAVLSALALTVWAAQYVLQRDPSDPPVAPTAPEPVTHAPEPPSETIVPSVPAPPPAAPIAPSGAMTAKRRRDSGHTTVDEPADRARSFAEEVSLLQRVITAQHAGQSSEARALIAEHRRRYPDGQLRAERERLATQMGSSGTP